MARRNLPDPDLKPAATSSAPGGTLSVCMIVKNEAVFLARCLASVKAAADQIVVVDTGSTDNSVQVARSFDAETTVVPWKNDFAWARNLSLERARCAWILWLDADDVVPPESLAKIVELKKQLPDRVFGFAIRNERPGNTGSEFVQARMFPNRPEIRFERRVHEQIMPSAFRLGLTMEKKNIALEHHGYADPGTLRIKAQRNIALMLDEYNPVKPDPVTAVEIADSYQLMEGWDKAEMWYHTVLSIPNIKSAAPAIASQAFIGMGSIAGRQRKHVQAIRHLDQAVALAPWRIDALYLLAVSHDCIGSADKAIGCLRRIPSIEDDPGQVGVDFRAVRIKSALRIMRILTDLHRSGEAIAEAHSACARHPDRGEVALMAAKVLMAHGELMESIKLFEKSIALAAGAPSIDSYIGLCAIYRRAGKEDHIRTTIENIQTIFNDSPRYWALRRELLNEPEPTGGPFSGDELVEEWNTAKRDFFGVV